MHVEISVALNFVISYLYNKLPRRRVDLFGEELEVGLKEKFQGHWYPEQPSKGSGFRCLKGNGDEVDPVLVYAAVKAGLDITEVRSYLPEDLTLWIDPSEVSYKIGEKGPVKVLYSDRKDEESNDNVDREVQAASRTFNPEAQTFTPESHQTFTPDLLAFTPDVAAFCSDSTQSFQPIDSLSSSLSNLSLSPSSPVPPGTWSTATSPSSNLFSSAMASPNIVPPSLVGPRAGNLHRQHMTAAMFAQTKFGSTKLKTQVKRPNRLSPTEFGNYFKQQQRSYAGPQRPRSLSPRDPRVEFLLDQQQRMLQQQQQQQMSPSLPYGPQFHLQQQQLSPTSLYPEMYRSPALSSAHSSPHLSPHLSPAGNGPTFKDLIQSNPNLSTIPSSPLNPISRPSSLTNLRRPTGFPSLNSPLSNSSSHTGSLGKMSMFSPEGHKSFTDGFNVASVNYSNNVQHLLMAN